MRQFNKFRGTKGFITIWKRVIRFRYMITEQAKERCRILAFWEKYGDEATESRALGGTQYRGLAKLERRKRSIPGPVGKIPRTGRNGSAELRNGKSRRKTSSGQIADLEPDRDRKKRMF
jgi:hypothetical protein